MKLVNFFVLDNNCDVKLFIHPSMQSERFVDETFSGSLPQFIASFSMRKKLSDREIEEIQKFIDERREV